MELRVFEKYPDLSIGAAAMMINYIERKPDALLCFATGDSPKLAYQLVAETIKREGTDISKCFFIGLDEWLGISPDNTGSCHYFLQQYLFGPMGVESSQSCLFDAMTTNEEEECKKMNKIIAERGGIDLMVAGIGMNGHIGFNEPGTDINSMAHVARLDEITQEVGKKYFTEEVAISKGITVGLKQVLQAKTLLMMASGKKKAPVIKRAVEEKTGTHWPASLIQQHANGVLMIDTEAASELVTQFR